MIRKIFFALAGVLAISATGHAQDYGDWPTLRIPLPLPQFTPPQREEWCDYRCQQHRRWREWHNRHHWDEDDD